MVASGAAFGAPAFAAPAPDMYGPTISAAETTRCRRDFDPVGDNSPPQTP